MGEALISSQREIGRGGGRRKFSLQAKGGGENSRKVASFSRKRERGVRHAWEEEERMSMSK